MKVKLNMNDIDLRELNFKGETSAESRDGEVNVTMEEFLRLFPNTNTRHQCVEVVNALLSKRFSLKIRKSGKYSRGHVEEEYQISFTDANIPQETNRFFRLLELLPEINIIIDSTLGAERRMTGYSLVLNEFRSEVLLSFLEVCGATKLEKVIMVILIHEYLRSDKQSMDAMCLFRFIPKSLYVRFLYYLENGSCLLEQKLIHKSYERFGGELKFSLDKRVIVLLNGESVDLIA
jgi:hypothetical protein